LDQADHPPSSSSTPETSVLSAPSRRYPPVGEQQPPLWCSLRRGGGEEDMERLRNYDECSGCRAARRRHRIRRRLRPRIVFNAMVIGKYSGHAWIQKFKRFYFKH
jgi:hypothetical protein